MKKKIQLQLLFVVFCLSVLSGCDQPIDGQADGSDVATYDDATFNNSTWK